jgi:hypothetical protein
MITKQPKNKDDELRMPADDFDRIMRQVFQGAAKPAIHEPEKKPESKPNQL